MKERLPAATSTADREIVALRLFNAPRELVFKVWTEPGHIVRWWGPYGFTNTIEKMDARPRGVWQFIMHGPDGVDYPNKITYIEVKKPERLVYDHGEEGQPGYFHVTVTLEDQGGKTRLSMQMLFKTAEERDQVVKKYGAVEGLNQTLGRLNEYLANKSGK
jgi:uncharacterized protein YndB with AHSA1/START domain